MSNVTLDQILDALSRGRQRATYGAVAALLDRAPRTLMKGRERDRRHSWVVNSGNGQPTGYSPEKYTEGMFGIIEGPETAVELLLHGKETTAFLASRRLHPTQRFTARPDGTTLLTMTVRGTAELSSWIVSQAPWVEVLRPPALRDEVGERLRAGARLYAPAAPRARRTAR